MCLAEWRLALVAQSEVMQAQRPVTFDASPNMVSAEALTACVTRSRAGVTSQVSA